MNNAETTPLRCHAQRNLILCCLESCSYKDDLDLIEILRSNN